MEQFEYLLLRSSLPAFLPLSYPWSSSTSLAFHYHTHSATILISSRHMPLPQHAEMEQVAQTLNH